MAASVRSSDLGLSPSISSHFTLLQQKSHKITKVVYFSGSRSRKVIDVDTINKHFTTDCYDKQHVYAYLQPFLRQTSQQRKNYPLFMGWVPHVPPRAQPP